MRDYEELVERLREILSFKKCAIAYDVDFPVLKIIGDAADAIEELCRENKRMEDKAIELQAIADHYEAASKEWFQTACEYKDAAPKWISVEERLPEPFISVLLCVPKLAPFPTVIEGYMSDAGTFHNVRILYDSIVQVTHWMPLPEPPPKEDDNA